MLTKGANNAYVLFAKNLAYRIHLGNTSGGSFTFTNWGSFHTTGTDAKCCIEADGEDGVVFVDLVRKTDNFTYAIAAANIRLNDDGALDFDASFYENSVTEFIFTDPSGVPPWSDVQVRLLNRDRGIVMIRPQSGVLHILDFYLQYESSNSNLVSVIQVNAVNSFQFPNAPASATMSTFQGTPFIAYRNDSTVAIISSTPPDLCSALLHCATVESKEQCEVCYDNIYWTLGTEMVSCADKSAYCDLLPLEADLPKNCSLSDCRSFITSSTCDPFVTLEACGDFFSSSTCFDYATLEACGGFFSSSTCSPFVNLEACSSFITSSTCFDYATLDSCGGYFSSSTCAPFVTLETCSSFMTSSTCFDYVTLDSCGGFFSSSTCFDYATLDACQPYFSSSTCFDYATLEACSSLITSSTCFDSCTEISERYQQGWNVLVQSPLNVSFPVPLMNVVRNQKAFQAFAPGSVAGLTSDYNVLDESLSIIASNSISNLPSDGQLDFTQLDYEGAKVVSWREDNYADIVAIGFDTTGCYVRLAKLNYDTNMQISGADFRGDLEIAVWKYPAVKYDIRMVGNGAAKQIFSVCLRRNMANLQFGTATWQEDSGISPTTVFFRSPASGIPFTHAQLLVRNTDANIIRALVVNDSGWTTVPISVTGNNNLTGTINDFFAWTPGTRPPLTTPIARELIADDSGGATLIEFMKLDDNGNFGIAGTRFQMDDAFIVTSNADMLNDMKTVRFNEAITWDTNQVSIRLLNSTQGTLVLPTAEGLYLYEFTMEYDPMNPLRIVDFQVATTGTFLAPVSSGASIVMTPFQNTTYTAFENDGNVVLIGKGSSGACSALDTCAATATTREGCIECYERVYFSGDPSITACADAAAYCGGLPLESELVTLETCSSFITSSTCDPFVNLTSCQDYFTSSTCFDYATLAACGGFFSSSTCFDYATLAACSSFITSSTCFDSATLASCQPYFSSSTCFDYATLEACSSLITSSTCFDSCTEISERYQQGWNVLVQSPLNVSFPVPLLNIVRNQKAFQGLAPGSETASDYNVLDESLRIITSGSTSDLQSEPNSQRDFEAAKVIKWRSDDYADIVAVGFNSDRTNVRLAKLNYDSNMQISGTVFLGSFPVAVPANPAIQYDMRIVNHNRIVSACIREGTTTVQLVTRLWDENSGISGSFTPKYASTGNERTFTHVQFLVRSTDDSTIKALLVGDIGCSTVSVTGSGATPVNQMQHFDPWTGRPSLTYPVARELIADDSGGATLIEFMKINDNGDFGIVGTRFHMDAMFDVTYNADMFDDMKIVRFNEAITWDTGAYRQVSIRLLNSTQGILVLPTAEGLYLYDFIMEYDPMNPLRIVDFQVASTGTFIAPVSAASIVMTPFQNTAYTAFHDGDKVVLIGKGSSGACSALDTCAATATTFGDCVECYDRVYFSGDPSLTACADATTYCGGLPLELNQQGWNVLVQPHLTDEFSVPLLNIVRNRKVFQAIAPGSVAASDYNVLDESLSIIANGSSGSLQSDQYSQRDFEAAKVIRWRSDDYADIVAVGFTNNRSKINLAKLNYGSNMRISGAESRGSFEIAASSNSPIQYAVRIVNNARFVVACIQSGTSTVRFSSGVWSESSGAGTVSTAYRNTGRYFTHVQFLVRSTNVSQMKVLLAGDTGCSYVSVTGSGATIGNPMTDFPAWTKPPQLPSTYPVARELIADDSGGATLIEFMKLDDNGNFGIVGTRFRMDATFNVTYNADMFDDMKIVRFNEAITWDTGAYRQVTIRLLNSTQGILVLPTAEGLYLYDFYMEYDPTNPLRIVDFQVASTGTFIAPVSAESIVMTPFQNTTYTAFHNNGNVILIEKGPSGSCSALNTCAATATTLEGCVECYDRVYFSGDPSLTACADAATYCGGLPLESELVTLETCSSFITSSTCDPFVNLTSCQDYFTSSTCFDYATLTACGGFFSSSTCFDYATLAACQPYFSSSTCFDYATLAACSSFITSSTCFDSATLASCQPYFSSSTCFDYATLAACSSFITSSTCFDSATLASCQGFIDVDNCRHLITPQTCSSFINSSACDAYVNLGACATYITSSTCAPFVNLEACSSFITSSTCFDSATLAACQPFFSSSTCFDYATLAACSSFITSSTCFDSATLAACQPYFSSSTCFDYATLAACSSFITSSTCFDSATLASCQPYFSSSTCFDYATLAACSSFITSSTCFDSATLASCQPYFSSSTCFDYTTLAACSSFITSSTCFDSATLASCQPYFSSSTCFDYATLAACSSFITSSTCFDSTTLASCQPYFSSSTCFDYATLGACSSFITSSTCFDSATLASCQGFIDVDNCRHLITPQTCSSFINSSACDAYVNLGACATYITSSTCSPFVNLGACSSFITSSTCDPFVTLNSCGQFFSSSTCFDYATLGACSSFITSSTCDPFVTLNSCGQFFSSSTCFDYATLGACSSFITSSTCDPFVTLNSCGQFFSSSTCFDYATLGACSSFITSSTCDSFVTLNSCGQFFSSSTCFDYATLSACSSFITSSTCDPFVTLNSCGQFFSSSTCFDYATLGACSSFITSSTCDPFVTLNSCGQFFSSSTCFDYATLAACSSFVTSSTCDPFVTLNSCGQFFSSSTCFDYATLAACSSFITSSTCFNNPTLDACSSFITPGNCDAFVPELHSVTLCLPSSRFSVGGVSNTLCQVSTSVWSGYMQANTTQSCVLSWFHPEEPVLLIDILRGGPGSTIMFTIECEIVNLGVTVNTTSDRPLSQPMYAIRPVRLTSDILTIEILQELAAAFSA